MKHNIHKVYHIAYVHRRATDTMQSEAWGWSGPGSGALHQDSVEGGDPYNFKLKKKKKKKKKRNRERTLHASSRDMEDPDSQRKSEWQKF